MNTIDMLQRMKKGVHLLIVIVAMMMPISSAIAQGKDIWSQADVCPGWNNPSNFRDGNADNFYSGQAGEVSGTAPNVLTNQTGMNMNGSLYTANQLASAANTGCSGSTWGSIPSHDHLFYINTSLTGTDPNTNNNLKYVPTQFNTHDTTGNIVNTNIQKSIRIGDDCSGSSTISANALYYQVMPTPQNALFFLYYAVVVQYPGHGVANDPTFVIRIMRDANYNPANPSATPNWQIITDTLAYYVASTPTSAGGTVQIVPTGQTGWHTYGSGYNAINYKDWAKVAINLNNYLYQRLRIEIMMSDCGYHAHYGYAYIAGECRPMQITAAGCPAGASTDVTTLSAPRGMLSYRWYASNWGVSEPTNRLILPLGTENSTAHYSFRRISAEADTTNPDYHVQANDFIFTRTGTATDSTACQDTGASQTFKCIMTSAIDPSKPFKSTLYVNVTNTKPSMAIRQEAVCDGTVKLTNLSQVPGMTGGVADTLTKWVIYNNATAAGTVDTTLIGDSVRYLAQSLDQHGLKVYSYYKEDTTCYTTANYLIKPLQNPKTGFTISDDVLCDADQTTMTDTTSDVTYRVWRFVKYNDPNDPTDTNRIVLDSVIGASASTNRSHSRGFENSVNPIELYNRNGLYYLNPENQADTIWCYSVALDTVSVFLHPELAVTGDTIVCQGSPTDATVNAVGVENCTYQWSRTLGSISGGLPAGNHLAVVPYADTATYYVRVTSPQGCVAWDSINAYLVRPELYMLPADGRICPGDTAMLIGAAADHYSWTASTSDPSLAGQTTADTIYVSPTTTTTYTMVGHGSNDCDATPLKKTVTIVPLPVPHVVTDPEFIDSDNPTITLRDASPYSVRSSWLFSGNERVDGKEITHTFDEAMSSDTAYVLLTAYNELDCSIDYMHGIPVHIFTAWFPNAFTPGSEDENAKFRLYTINHYQNFHIRIYNRRGELVFESQDPNFEWDGTNANGDRLPQGAYVYICNYLKPGTGSLNTINGTITLIR